MRIISGKYRGMKLVGFDGTDIRPTADRVKESLFNILYGEISGARVLDLFAGSGSVGIECLSRGADFVHFNDLSQSSVAILKKNLSRLKDGNFSVTNLDYTACLSRGVRYDFIFVDPPYRSEAGIRALEIIGAERLLNADGVAVFERDEECSAEICGLKKTDCRKYGKTYLNFFEADL